MPAKQQKKQVNLLPQSELETTTFGRILHWITTSFRIIVIATELVVMCAFLSRFWLDAKSTDLADQIKQKEAQITAQKDFEKTFRLTQKRLDIFSQVAAKETSASSNLKLITSLLPQSIALNSYSYAANTTTIRGEAVNETDIAQLIVNLEKVPTFAKVQLENISSDAQSGSVLIFSVKITPKG